jgi:hypothetical protein
MSGRLRIEYNDGARITILDRPVGDPWATLTKAGPDRDDLAAAMDAAKAELLDAAHPSETTEADAWDDGFTACATEHTAQRNDPTHPITRLNPHHPGGGTR